MTERKPPDVSFESWVEKQIREAAERGELDGLAGEGQPLPNLDRSWLTAFAEREDVSLEAALPEPLQLRKEIERLPETVAGLRSEPEVRGVVRTLNERIARWFRSGRGPHVPVKPVDPDAVVARWAEHRSDRSAERRSHRPGRPR